MDLREAMQAETTFKNLLRLARVASVTILGVVALYQFAPAEPETKTIVKTVSAQTEASEPAIPPEPKMSRAEFDTIQKGERWDDIVAAYGRPEGNVDLDGKEFYPAENGGTYWLYMDNNKGSRITRKEYVK